MWNGFEETVLSEDRKVETQSNNIKLESILYAYNVLLEVAFFSYTNQQRFCVKWQPVT